MALMESRTKERMTKNTSHISNFVECFLTDTITTTIFTNKMVAFCSKVPVAFSYRFLFHFGIKFLPRVLIIFLNENTRKDFTHFFFWLS